MKKSKEIIFTFENCRHWLRFPGIIGEELTSHIEKLRAERAGGSAVHTKPMQTDNGEQSELAVIDVFITTKGYEFKLGDISVAENSIFF